jgi:GDPmannose 4,6-dehydratase
MFACNGILFNHESPVRGETFVTRKITRGLARVSLGLEDTIFLGNLDAKRDWGHAKDYVEMQWLMLQQDSPDDYCIATGIQYSVRDFINFAWSHLGKSIRWEGSGLDEKGYDSETNKLIVAVDPSYFRPTEVETLLGDPTKAKEKLGWEPKITLKQMVYEMMENDINIAKRDSLIKEHGFKVLDYKE